MWRLLEGGVYIFVNVSLHTRKGIEYSYFELNVVDFVDKKKIEYF